MQYLELHVKGQESSRVVKSRQESSRVVKSATDHRRCACSSCDAQGGMRCAVKAAHTGHYVAKVPGSTYGNASYVRSTYVIRTFSRVPCTYEVLYYDPWSDIIIILFVYLTLFFSISFSFVCILIFSLSFSLSFHLCSFCVRRARILALYVLACSS